MARADCHDLRRGSKKVTPRDQVIEVFEVRGEDYKAASGSKDMPDEQGHGPVLTTEENVDIVVPAVRPSCRTTPLPKAFPAGPAWISGAP